MTLKNITLSNSELSLSQTIENLLVERNLRGMAQVQPHLEAGYCMRAAKAMQAAVRDGAVVFIGTGFPVIDTFETDGPPGAISLYRAIEACGGTPYICCGAPLSGAIVEDYRVIELAVGEDCEQQQHQEAEAILKQYSPGLVISIERPGKAADGGYYNMRGESISPRSACFDEIMQLCQCTTLAIGDGGNEIGMGKVHTALSELNIVPAATSCDELIVADVSNWGGHALVALLGYLRNQDLLASFDNIGVLRYLSERGSVDGVTRENTLTEDSLDAAEGSKLLYALRQHCGFVD
ncbi:glutamate cyclase domain-containing protein [Pseudoteredinibacter isoporae]|uniref:D-glutamate cyclase-like C-terminal domain-containing protein n=1 Tax=Pseudoteredinibacter isoporae TaxID=570281 RepID=A0A7X0MXG1_9GAMM|nr:glutamate cyclase domain-containing protein [Pseudoteredinibacter isoporae]MBB6520892.1 hypothetical protein [Pseudoteredinibacter isoporae]NHO86457.1 DUF4392 domain-containing protein [Pseudoteredinibacter isoporae]NIB25091.1 DUF4392 domain-containing protein [Pseudoteredinibacter isoporae]